MEKASFNPSFQNKPIPLMHVFLTMTIHIMRTRIAAIASWRTLVEYTGMCSYGALNWPTQNSAEPMRWILWPFCDLPSTCLPAKPRHLGWKNGLDREKVHCGLQMLPPPSCGKNNDRTITIAAESQSHSPSLLAELQSNEDQTVVEQLWKASAMLRQHLQERRWRKQARKRWWLLC